MSGETIKLSDLFNPAITGHSLVTARNGALRRNLFTSDCGYSFVLDDWSLSGVSCSFTRFVPSAKSSVEIIIDGNYRGVACVGGGWLALPSDRQDFSFWIPQGPVFRTFNKDSHILTERCAEIKGVGSTDCRSSVEIESSRDEFLDWLVWRVPAGEAELIDSLQCLSNLESQPIFLWGSHTLYRRPADVYTHLIYGHVYENRNLWPFNRKSCSENDAHALYVTLCGLQRASGKKFYALLKDQLLLSVMARQASDGGWHHGEWSEDMEAHLRLNGSAIHLLMDSLAERNDPAVRQALERAVSFVARHRDETAVGAWFLHDSLELTEAAMKNSPFRWQASRVLGKSVSNMLVLNTHIDSLVLMDRYRQVTGDARYQGLIDSAKSATRAVLNLRPLESVFRFLFQLFRLNLLPKRRQMNLPLPLRALKRLTRQWLTPNFYRITARYPRLVMPGGYIERAVTLRGMADDYHSVNVMDLGRYWRRFPEEQLAPIIRQAVEFIRKNHVDSHWGESKWKNYALGFWAEALYHLYLLTEDRETLSYLAEIMIKLEEHGIGLPPSLLGANCESVARRDQIGCPSPTDVSLRVANLSRSGRVEFLVVNPTGAPRQLSWETIAPVDLHWQSSAGAMVRPIQAVELPAKGWIVGFADVSVEGRFLSKQKAQAYPEGVLP